jgi:hypothetical protein
VTVGSQHACVLTAGGDAWCWGFATDGALGAGSDVTSTDMPLRVDLPRPAVDIDAGFEGTCAILDDGSAWCWGRNESGEVGDGTTENRFVPTAVVGLPSSAISISRGHDHACAVLDDGGAWCWGDNLVGELGTGRTAGSATSEPRPVRVPRVPLLAQITSGAGHTCALTGDGAAWCWGSSLYGVLGRADGAEDRVPGPVVGLDSGVDVVVAGDDQTCAIRAGSLLCWGLVDESVARTDIEAATRRTPTVVDLGRPIMEVDLANGYHRCARDEAGATWCWGNAEVGQLGPSVGQDTDWVMTPVRQDLPGATAIATGYDITCALLAPRDLRCWGDGDPIPRNPWTGETGAPAGGFREPGPLVPTITTFIPTPRDVSTDPPVVGANLLLAALVMILFTVAGEFLNRTLAESEDRYAARGGALAKLRRARVRLDLLLARRLGAGKLLLLVRLAGIAAMYGLVFSVLDRTWNPLSVTGLWLFASMAVAFGIVGIADDLACWSVARRWGVAAAMHLRPGNLAVAVTSTVASRLATLVPGVMIGMPEALDVDTDALDDRRRARLAAVGLGTLAAVGAFAWAVTLVTSLAGSSGDQGVAVLLGGVESFFLVVFAVTVQNGFAQLLAFRGTPGRILRASHRWLWLAGLTMVTFLFWHTLVNPRGDLADALRATNVLAFVATATGFVALAFAVWLFSRLRRRRSSAGVALPVPGLAPEAPGSSTLVHPGAGHPESPPPVGTALAGGSTAATASPVVAAAPPAMSASATVVAPLVAAPVPSSPASSWTADAPPSAAPVPPGPCPATTTVPASPAVPGWVAPGWPTPIPTAVGAPGSAPAVEFDLRAVGDRRLHRRVRLRVQPDGVGLAGSWARRSDDRAERIANGIVVTLIVTGLVGIALLSTIPGFRFYQVPWLLPSAGVAALGVTIPLLVIRVARARRRWSGEVVVPAGQLIGVRTSFDRRPLVAACILLTPIGGATYAALVGRNVVRLRGPFDPERSSAVEVRLRCQDRDEAADVAARVRAILEAAPKEVFRR